MINLMINFSFFKAFNSCLTQYVCEYEGERECRVSESHSEM